MKYLKRLDTYMICLHVFIAIFALYFIPSNFSFLDPLQQAIGDFDITDMAQSKFRDDAAQTT
jgi:hypothetical protein